MTVGTSRMSNRGDQKDILADAQVVEQILHRVLPTPRRSRLRLMQDDRSDTYRSIHRGAAAAAEGSFAALRNPHSHADGLPERAQHEALTAGQDQASREAISRAASRAVRPTPIRVAEAGPVQSP